MAAEQLQVSVRNPERMSTATTLRDAYLETVAELPDLVCAVWSPAGLAEATLAELHEHADRVARHLASLGVGKGNVVAVQLPHCLEWPVIAIAAALLGAAVQPISPAVGSTELGYVLRNSGAKVLIHPGIWKDYDYAKRLADAGGIETLHHVFTLGDARGGKDREWRELIALTDLPLPHVDVRPEDISWLIYTSGTTANPKGVKHSQASLLYEIRQLMKLKPPQGAAMTPWPAGHIAGVLTLLRALAGGVTTVMMERWNAEAAARLIEKFKVTSSGATPFFWMEILDYAEANNIDLSSLQDIQCGAAPVPPSLIFRFDKLGLATYRSYGSTEHPTVTSGFPTDPLERRMTTEGRIIPGIGVKIVDEDGNDLPIGSEGEIVTRGLDMFVGYHDESLNATAFLPGGWYRTGDIGKLDDEDYLFITDRKKDIIIRGGENISSKEVEEHLVTHPSVAEVAVVAAPDKRMGEIVCAFVVLHEGKTLDIPTIGKYFEERGVARRKTPERLEFRTDLPRNATGKVMKPELRKTLAKPAA